MGLIRILARFKSGSAWRKFEAACRDPERAQQESWETQLRLMRNSEFWKDRIPASGKLRDFPITKYDDYQSSLESSYPKTISSLNGEPILHWAESTGTTGKRKTLPVTPTYKKQFQTVNLPFVAGLLRRFPRFLDSKVLYLTSLGPTDRTTAGIGIGFISGFNYLNTPALLARAYALPPETLKDGPTYARWAPIHAAAANVGGILSITPARIRQIVEEIWDRRKEILSVLKSDPTLVSRDRLAILEMAFAEPELRLRAIWPNLEFVGSWKTSGCGPQVDTVLPYLDADAKYIDVMYSATEGWINVPTENDRNGGAVHPGGVICEFIEEGKEMVKENILPLWKLEPGKTYEIFLTNHMGLVRYRLFDWVRCTGYFHRSPIIEFVGKALREFMLGRLRIGELQLYELLSTAGVGLPENEICFSRSKSGDEMVFLVKVSRTTTPDLADRLDQGLRKLNPYYDSDRKVGMLKPLQVVSLPENHPLWQGMLHAQSKPRIFTEAW